ncbi:MAG: SPFH domain-containing protein [Gammaproteobacteria bacterium]
MNTTREQDSKPLNGWLMLVILIAAAVGLAMIVPGLPLMGLGALVLWATATTLWALCMGGFFTLQPNMAAALTLFGKYKRTAKVSGFHWANPLFKKNKISLRAQNLDGTTIKVNDLRGNPIEIALVVVWRVTDTARALFDVDDFASYVSIQSDSALRQVAMAYPYDSFEDGELSLRGSIDEISEMLSKAVQERIIKAGIRVDEARINHLAYAPEIAGAMLQRQQAEAVVAARHRIVEGAVSMVEMALTAVEKQGLVKLDEERKAAMISNLLVILCGDKNARPVVNTGTLYT